MSSNLHLAKVNQGIKIEVTSIVWMIMEALGTLIAGIMASSVALESFGIDSVIEIIAGVTLLWRLLVERNGKSQQTIQRAEKISAWIVGMGLLVLALYILGAASTALIFGESTKFTQLGLTVIVISSILMPIFSLLKRRIGKTIGSKALEADGFCSMVCAYMSWIVLLGLLATWLLGWRWIDSVAALALVYFVVKEGIEAINAARSNNHQCGCCSANDQIVG